MCGQRVNSGAAHCVERGLRALRFINFDLVFRNLPLLNQLNNAFAYRSSGSALMCSAIKTESPSLLQHEKTRSMHKHNRMIGVSHVAQVKSAPTVAVLKPYEGQVNGDCQDS